MPDLDLDVASRIITDTNKVKLTMPKESTEWNAAEKRIYGLLYGLKNAADHSKEKEPKKNILRLASWIRMRSCHDALATNCAQFIVDNSYTEKRPLKAQQSVSKKGTHVSNTDSKDGAVVNSTVSIDFKEQPQEEPQVKDESSSIATSETKKRKREDDESDTNPNKLTKPKSSQPNDV
jgi:hypothetical protein